MQLLESLLFQSLENFLTTEELRFVNARMAQLLASYPPDHFQAGRTESVHFLDVLPEPLPAVEARRVYQPSGRTEVNRLPDDVIAVLDTAFFRRIEDIRRFFPAATWPRYWTYLEYGPEQDCTLHADGAGPDRRQLGALSVLLDDDFEGGEFYVETAGTGELWHPSGECQDPAVGYGNAWLRNLPRTRWTPSVRSGTAVAWGCHVIHGTSAVRCGRAKKVICFIQADSVVELTSPRQAIVAVDDRQPEEPAWIRPPAR